MASGDVIVPVNLMGATTACSSPRAMAHRSSSCRRSRVYPATSIERLAYEECETRFEVLDDEAVAGASARGVAEDFALAGSRTIHVLGRC